jgi:hypothetical protein
MASNPSVPAQPEFVPPVPAEENASTQQTSGFKRKASEAFDGSAAASGADREESWYHEGTQTTGKAADAGTVIHRANKLLLKAGVEQSDLLGASYCLRAAIGRGIIPFNGTPEGLDFVITTGHCYSCDNDTLLNARIRDVLMQPDYAGTDYEAGGLRAGVQCANTSCNAGIYITGMCIGEPAQVSQPLYRLPRRRHLHI